MQEEGSIEMDIFQILNEEYDLFPAEEQRTLVVVEVMPKCLLMSEMYHVSGWVKMVMFLQYILVTLVILIHITLSPSTGSFLRSSLQLWSS